MVYQPPQQQPGYQQPPIVRTGGYVPPGYQPPAQQMPSPRWSGFQPAGGYRISLLRFIGKLDSWGWDTQSQFGARVLLNFSQVQPLEMTSPYPWATATLSIKHSDRENSAWQRLTASARELGFGANIAIDDPRAFEKAMGEMMGRLYEMRQTTGESFGEDREGKELHGDVWRFVRVVTGMVPPSAFSAPMAPPVAPPAVAPVVPPAQPTLDLTPTPTDTAPIRAKKLLHGRNLAEFLSAVLIDPVIKDPTNAGLFNSILDRSFMAALVSNGQVVLDPTTQVYTVVK